MKLEVNSRDRISGTPEDYVFELRQAVKDVRGFSLVGAYVANTMYRIVTGYNDKFKIKYAPPVAVAPLVYTDYTLTITGNRDYTITQLVAALQAAIDGAIGGGVVTLAYDTDTNKLSVENLDIGFIPGKFVFVSSSRQLFPTAISSGDISIDLTATGVARLGAWLLGVSQTDPTQVATSADDTVAESNGAGPVVLPNQLNMQYPMNRLHLQVGEAAGPIGNGVRTSFGDTTYTVPLTVNHADFQEWFALDTFEQAVSISDDGIAKIRVRWRAADPDLDSVFTFGGVDHVLIIDVVEY